MRLHLFLCNLSFFWCNLSSLPYDKRVNLDPLGLSLALVNFELVEIY